MEEIGIHGRGGQGSLVLAQFMALAALEDGIYGQAFPFLGGGGERRGKPIVAFCRLDTKPIRLRSRVKQADYVILQDSTILEEVDVAGGVKKGGLILANTEKSPETLGLGGDFRVVTFSANEMARKILGTPIINTALLGAFAAVTRALTLEGVVRAVVARFPGGLGKKNAEVVRRSYGLFSGG